MDHLTRSWRNAAATSGVSLLLLDHTDPEAAAEHLRGHGVTAARAEPNEWGREVMHTLTTTGGFSFHDHIGDAPHTGFMVSLDKGTEKVIPLRDVTGAAIADFAAVHAQELADPDNYLGGWVWKGNVYLDVSRHIPDKEQALALARQHSQIGIYDIGEGKTIVTATGQYEAKVISMTAHRPALAVTTGTDYDGFANLLRSLGGVGPAPLSGAELRRWFYDYPGDVRNIEPEDLPPGACPDRVHRDGDPSSPCVLPADHAGQCQDVEGYHSDW